MKLKVNSDIFKGCLFGIIALILFLITPSQVGIIEGETINSRSFPYLVLTIMAVSSAILIIQGLTSKSKTYFEFSLEAFKEWIIPLTVFACILIYVLVLPHIGFVIASIIACTLLLVLIKCKKIPYYIVSYVCVIAIYLVFTELLMVPLPAMPFF